MLLFFVHDFRWIFSEATTHPFTLVVIFGAAAWFLRNTLRFFLLGTPIQDRRPPQPFGPGLPVVGHLHRLDRRTHVTLTEMRAHHGDVCRLKLGSWPALVVSGQAAVKEAFVRRGQALSSRPGYRSYSRYADGKSLSFQPYNEALKLHRRLTLKVIKGLVESGFAEAVVIRQVTQLTDAWVSNNRRGKAFDPAEELLLAVAGGLYSLCYGREASLSQNKDFEKLFREPNPATELLAFGNPVDLVPPPLCPLRIRKKYDEYVSRMNLYQKLNEDQVTRHQLRAQRKQSLCRYVTDDVTKNNCERDDVAGNGCVYSDVTRYFCVNNDVSRNGSVRDDVTRNGSVDDDVTRNGNAHDDVIKDSSVHDDVQGNIDAFDDVRTNSFAYDDFVDAMIDASNDLDVTSGLTKQHLLNTPIEMLSAGSDTSSTTLLWLIHYMADHPDTQEAIYQEISREVSSGRAVSYSDRKRLPLTEATVLEVMRLHAVVPFALPHFSTQSCQVGGYTIPKHCLVFMNLWSVGRDRNIWGDSVDEFRPARFLRTQGSDTQVDDTKAGLFYPFGVGRRRCVGEMLGRVQVFLFFANIIRRCSIRKADDSAASGQEVFGDILRPSRYLICVEER